MYIKPFMYCKFDVEVVIILTEMFNQFYLLIPIVDSYNIL